jgi:hypothetical protein
MVTTLRPSGQPPVAVNRTVYDFTGNRPQFDPAGYRQRAGQGLYTGYLNPTWPAADTLTFEGGIGEWATNAGLTISQDATVSHSGTGSLKLVCGTAFVSCFARDVFPGFKIPPGQVQFGGQFLAGQAATKMILRITWYDLAQNQIGSPQEVVGGPSSAGVAVDNVSWTALDSGAITPPDGAYYATLGIQPHDVGTFWADDLYFTTYPAPSTATSADVDATPAVGAGAAASAAVATTVALTAAPAGGAGCSGTATSATTIAFTATPSAGAGSAAPAAVATTVSLVGRATGGAGAATATATAATSTALAASPAVGAGGAGRASTATQVALTAVPANGAGATAAAAVATTVALTARPAAGAGASAPATAQTAVALAASPAAGAGSAATPTAATSLSLTAAPTAGAGSARGAAAVDVDGADGGPCRRSGRQPPGDSRYDDEPRRRSRGGSRKRCGRRRWSSARSPLFRRPRPVVLVARRPRPSPRPWP